MTKRLILIGLLVVGVAFLSGCDLLDQILDAISGITNPGGTPGGSAGGIVSGRMEFHLWGNINQDDGTTTQGPIGTTFMSGAGTYDASTRTFTATWDGGDFSNTYFEARLNATEEYVEYFYARQTQANVWFAWTFVHEIRGYNILYSHTDGNSKYFVVDGSDAHVIVDLLNYKSWSNAIGSATNPVDWMTGPGALIGDTTDVISIRLDY